MMFFEPLELEELSFTIEKLVQVQTLALEDLILKDRLANISRFENLVGQSPPMLDLFGTIVDVAQTDATVLITGETGTGKELVARASTRKSRGFMRPSLPSTAGPLRNTSWKANSSAMKKAPSPTPNMRKKGRLEMADAGTLFLDEVGDMTLWPRSRCCGSLETHKFTRVGGDKEIARRRAGHRRH